MGRWRRDQAHADEPPPFFADVVGEVGRFIDPLVQGMGPETVWESLSGAWN
jgi:hypothetical protein